MLLSAILLGRNAACALMCFVLLLVIEMNFGDSGEFDEFRVVEEQVKEFVDPRGNEKPTDNYMISILGILVAVLVALLTWYNMKKDPKLTANTSGIGEDTASTSGESESESDYLRKLVEMQTQNEVLSGKTDKYDWKQNDTEIEISIPIAADLKRSDVVLEASNRSLRVSICGSEIINGKFYADIIGEDSNWQFEGSGDNRRLEFTAPKKVPTQRSQHWRCALQGDGEIDVSKLGPPVHAVDANNKDSIRAAIEQVKAARRSK